MDALERHALSCKRSEERHQRHATIMALSQCELPFFKLFIDPLCSILTKSSFAKAVQWLEILEGLVASQR